MKRLLMIAAAVVLMFASALRVSAVENDYFEEEKQQIENSVPEDTRDGMRKVGIGGIEDLITGGIDISSWFEYAGQVLLRNSALPLSSLTVLMCVIIIASIAESYTYSLRYTHTKEIMSAAVSLMIASAVLSPIAELSADAANVIRSSSSMMLLYLPITAGIMAFSGRVIGSAGYYTAVVMGAGFLSRLSSTVLSPLLNAFLSLSVCGGICSRLNLSGVTETAAKLFKWLLTFAVSMFIAVVGMNSALASAGDGLTGKAAKFTLTSLIPMIGASLSEAYQTIKGSLGLLRSGMGVFVIIAVIISFAPVLARTLIWSLAAIVSKTAADAFGVSSASRIFGAVSVYLSALRALIIGVMAAFIMSSAVMLRIGGAA